MSTICKIEYNPTIIKVYLIPDFKYFVEEEKLIKLKNNLYKDEKQILFDDLIKHGKLLFETSAGCDSVEVLEDVNETTYYKKHVHHEDGDWNGMPFEYKNLKFLTDQFFDENKSKFLIGIKFKGKRKTIELKKCDDSDTVKALGFTEERLLKSISYGKYMLC